MSQIISCSIDELETFYYILFVVIIKVCSLWIIILKASTIKDRIDNVAIHVDSKRDFITYN